MNQWARLKRILTLSCAEAAELSSQRLDEPLSWTDKLAWAGHLLVCRSCRRFRRQLDALRTAAQRITATADETGETADALSPQGKNRIARAIRDAGG